MRRWAFWLTLGIGGGGIGLALLNELSPIRWHISFFEEWALFAWQKRLRQTAADLYASRETPSFWQTRTDVLYLLYSASGQLREWNTTRWLFPQTQPSLFSSDPEIISDESASYYALKLFSDTNRHIALLPLWIQPGPLSVYPRWDFPVQGDKAWIQALCLRERGNGYPIVLRDLRGEPILRVYIGCPEALRLPLRWVYGALVGTAVIIGLILFWLYLKERYAKAHLIFLGVLIGIWQFSHWTGLPEKLLPLDIFSPEKCALSPFHTSFWDLAWNLVILLWITQLLPHGKPPLKWVYPVGYWLMWMVFGTAFFLIVKHSQIEIDPVRTWDAFSLVGWAIVLLILWQITRYLHTLPLSSPLSYVVGAIVGIILSLLIEFPIWGTFALVGLYLSNLLTRVSPAYITYSVQSLLLIAIVNAWISWGHERKAHSMLEGYAKQVTRLRNPMIEYRMTQILPRMASDTLLWNKVGVEDYLIDSRFISLLIRKYFLSLTNEYEIVVSCWKSGGIRADNLFELRPLAWRQVKGRAIQIGLAPHLYFLTQGNPRYIYIARVPITLVEGSPLEVQIELYPRVQPLTSRIRAQFEPEPISYALYEGGQLIRQWGEGTFPLFLPIQPRTSPIWRTSAGYHEYIALVSSALSVYLRLPARDQAAHLATFPLLLTLLALCLIVKRAETIKQALYALYSRRSSFVQRFQILFGSFVFLPLFGILFVTFYLFFRLNQNQREQELIQKLSTVSGYLAGEAILSEKLAFWIQSYLPGEESFVRDLMRRVGSLSNSEVFIYTSGGSLYSSTLPAAYWYGLTSPLVPLHILNRMRQIGTGSIIEIDKNLGRLLGYAPLRTESGKLLGIIHIPYPIPKGSLYEPLRYFIAYTVNVYLLLSLASILVGLLLMERLSGGLQRLVMQLRAAPSLPDPPLLQWSGGNDEIATLVSAYNDMVDRLRASQRQLERTLRQVSQQEIAFQAAHEIKTALTPLKLHLQHLQRMPTVDPEKLKEISTRLLQRIEALVRIANTFTSFARLGSAEGLVLQPINLNTFLEEQLQPFFQNPHINFELSLPEEPLWIEGNPDALVQILNNLLQNALQVLEGASSPQLRVSLYREGKEAVIAVQDNGPGIPLEVRERIFEFYFTTRRTGTGLGLAITKGLVERMGGRISFFTEVGWGTIFYIAFPIKEEELSISGSDSSPSHILAMKQSPGKETNP
ncbi:MAG: HAMP domain-containing sensor histidine kinase [Bacteroidia bacterium]|nr:HAMP domain-containing histidine kinase [Bacteroidia bacterium]MDW8015961.1 HAMP domain-containing sensor histidine kinase [Bacteroidia bacterium]